MRIAESSTLVDGITTSLRWIVLVAIAVALAMQRAMTLEIALILLAASVWNIALTFLTALSRRLPAHRFMVLAIDILIVSLIFYLSKGLDGNVGWIGLLPVLTSTLYFHIPGSLLVSLLILVLQGLLALVFSAITPVLIFLGMLLPLYFGVSLLLGGLSKRLLDILTAMQRNQALSRREAERTEHERSRVIYKLISALNASLNFQRVLETALDLGYSALTNNQDVDSRLVSSVLMYTKTEGNETELRVGAARRFTPADLRISLPGTQGLIGQAIDEGGPRLAKGIHKDPELSRIVAVRACRAGYCIPLSTGLDTYGVLLFAHPDEGYFTADRREILEIIGNQAVVAIQNARLYHELELEKERMTEIQEEARKKLARDLHDGPAQSVAALAMRVNFARRLMDRDPHAAAEELFKVEELARRTVKEIRHMLFILRPLVLESQGLVAALQSMAEKLKETYNQNVVIEADPDIVSQIENGKQGVIFYIAEEAVNNARKHAQATHVWVRLKEASQDIAMLEIEDDGMGFDPESVNSTYDRRGSLGMLNMRERTELVNGYLQLDSSEGHGTRIRVIIPLTEDAADRIRRSH
jgi:signal transduction histidine kinase